MNVDSLRAFASGRVWTGLEALEIGLIDEIGGLKEALAIASTNAEVDSNYSVVFYPREKDFMEKFLEEMGLEVQGVFMSDEMRTFSPYIKKIKELETMQGVQARMPYELEVIH